MTRRLEANRIPFLPLRLLGWSLRPDERECVIGDLVEEYELHAAHAERRGAMALAADIPVAAPNVRRCLVRRQRSVPNERGVVMSGQLSDFRVSARLLGQQPLLATVALVSLLVGLGSGE